MIANKAPFVKTSLPLKSVDSKFLNSARASKNCLKTIAHAKDEGFLLIFSLRLQLIP